MAVSFVTCGNIEILPFKLKQLVELKMVQKINDHTRLYFRGILEEGSKDRPIYNTSLETRVELRQLDYDSTNTLIFKGIVSHLEIKAVRDIYYIEVEAVSLTQMLDVKLKSRSFQYGRMTYEELIKQVVEEYDGSINDEASEQKQIGKVIMQYHETDWQFLKRLASRFNTGLIPYLLSDTPKLFFGIPESGGEAPTLDNFNYRVRKKLADYRYSSENFIPGIDENDFVYYEVESEQRLNLGAPVTFKDKTLYIDEVMSYLDNSVLKHRYRIAPKKGLSQKTFYNETIVGLSVEGRVIEVAKDNVKVHMCIDPKQEVAEAFWFPYASVYTAEGNSGWYCMPELSDHVRIYFPTKKEEEGVALSSVRKDSEVAKHNKLGDPDVKYFRTKAGKELMFSPKEIIITDKDDQIYIQLNDEDGITLCSKKEIKVIAKEDLTMESEQAKVIIKAQDGIQIACKGSNIKMDPGSVVIKGNQVKTN
jgi:hypothetical protein